MTNFLYLLNNAYLKYRMKYEKTAKYILSPNKTTTDFDLAATLVSIDDPIEQQKQTEELQKWWKEVKEKNPELRSRFEENKSAPVDPNKREISIDDDEDFWNKLRGSLRDKSDPKPKQEPEEEFKTTIIPYNDRQHKTSSVKKLGVSDLKRAMEKNHNI
jgi:hypothetical protein